MPRTGRICSVGTREPYISECIETVKSGVHCLGGWFITVSMNGDDVWNVLSSRMADILNIFKKFSRRLHMAFLLYSLCTFVNNIALDYWTFVQALHLHGGAENARLENAELENAAPNCKTGKRETGKRGTKLQDWKTRERIGYGKPIKPKQPVI